MYLLVHCVSVNKYCVHCEVGNEYLHTILEKKKDALLDRVYQAKVSQFFPFQDIIFTPLQKAEL